MISDRLLIAACVAWAVLTAAAIGLPVWYYAGTSWLRAFVDACNHEAH